jgi:MFS family permease
MEAGFAPGVLFYLTLWFPVEYRGRITSTLFLASAFAGLLGAPAAGLVLSHLDGALGMAGWHWLFLVGGLPCVVLGLLVFKTLKDRIQDAGWLTAAEQALLSRPHFRAEQEHRQPLAAGRAEDARFPDAGAGLFPDSDRVVRPQLLGASSDPHLRAAPIPRSSDC